MEVSERKSNPEDSSLKLQYYIESDLKEPPSRSQVGTEKKYQHVQTNLAKKKQNKTKKYQERKLMIKELTLRIYSSCELAEHYINRIL